MVVFNNFNGRGMGDDPKYIALELLRRKENIRLIWLVKNTKSVSLPSEIKAVKYGSFKACFYMSLAKVWVDNCRGMEHIALKRKGQFYIQTWHATLGVKKLGTDNNKSSEQARKKAIRDMKITDLMYSNNDFRVDKYKHTFWYDGSVIKCDVPRVSFIKNQPAGLKKSVFSQLGIPESASVAMYAPTFRDDNHNEFDAYNFNFERIRKSLEVKFEKEFVLLVRLHPTLSDNPVIKCFKFSDKVLDATFMPDMEELLCITNVLFTDFSSSMFDFSIANKPVFLVAKDYQHYISVNRELYFDPKSELPFNMCESEDELISAIDSFEINIYRSKCERFFKKIGLVDSGCGDKVIADIIMSKLT